MLNASRDLLCSKLRWHNRPGPSAIIYNIAIYVAQQDVKTSYKQGAKMSYPS